MRAHVFKVIIYVIIIFLNSAASAQISEPKQASPHEWQVPANLSKTEAYFTNLPADGKVEMPFVLKFGLSESWGLAPITKPLAGKSGHHHLLINTALPIDLSKPIPFTEKHVHFGKGQMEVVLNLAPGKHTLRLLLADHVHKLHFVYSKEHEIFVTKKNTVDPKSLAAKQIEFLNLKKDEPLKPPFRLQFHASGFNIAHLQQQEKETGHFRLKLTSIQNGKTQTISFTNGQTETWLQPPAGNYRIKLELISNESPEKKLAETQLETISVTR